MSTYGEKRYKLYEFSDSSYLNKNNYYCLGFNQSITKGCQDKGSGILFFKGSL